MLDSGGSNGRAWQRLRASLDIDHNDKVAKEELDRVVEHLDSQPVQYIDDYSLESAKTSEDLEVYKNTYHHMIEDLELDELCKSANASATDSWSDKYSFTTLEAEQIIDEAGLEEVFFDNTYNYDSTLDEVLLIRGFKSPDSEEADYLLIAKHNGADVRGGYTTTKLFKVSDWYFDTNPAVYFGTLDTSYNGYSLTNEDGEAIDITPEIRDMLKEYAV